jgi:hypothetical protein
MAIEVFEINSCYRCKRVKNKHCGSGDIPCKKAKGFYHFRLTADGFIYKHDGRESYIDDWPLCQNFRLRYRPYHRFMKIKFKIYALKRLLKNIFHGREN